MITAHSSPPFHFVPRNLCLSVILILFYVFLCCSVTKSYPTHYNHMNYSIPSFPALHCLPNFARTYVHWVSDAIQPSHPLSPSSPPALNLSQHQGFSNDLSRGQSIGVSASASVLPMKDWYSGLISFRIDWFGLLAFPGTLKSLLQHHSLKVSILKR